jgi:DNA-binding NarL/FixJ family response regulator
MDGMVGRALNTTRRFTDPSELTPYEQKILDLRRQGLKYKEIAAQIGNISERSVSVKYIVIKEKLAARGETP